MYTSDALSDMTKRSHESLQKLLDHCRDFSDEEFNREIDGFGYPSLREQFLHEIGAQKYWIGVLEGRMDTDENAEAYPSVDSLEAYRQEMLELTESYLQNASPEELNTAREMITWGDNKVELAPARVVLRTLTHFYQHQGQISAMCRLLGRPIPPRLDFPIQ